jgi:hypothetical protein
MTTLPQLVVTFVQAVSKITGRERLGHYRRLHLYLHEEMGVNHKKVQRVYRELGLKREAHATQASAADARAATSVDGA